MSQNDVEKIKERLGIEEVVGSYLKLDRAGKNMKARCPFHNEKSPSFIVSPDRGTYYCFGCGAKGDIFSFVQEFEGLDFTGALKVLADRAGIELTKINSKEKDRYDRLRSILELSTKFYELHLSRNTEAIEYLKSRGLSEETINEWRLGYVPDGWDNLYSFLQKKGFKDSEIEEAGLIKKGEKGKSYDRFRSRIMFPICDSGGRPVGFTGRTFKGKPDDAKYLNSPETPLFEKSKILYGFDKAKTAIRKFDFSILVEGQMDLIMSHQSGYKNAVASSGTALTEEQLHLISRISDKMVIAYDSDGAGFRASEKAWQMALALGMDIKIAPIPAGQDPADVISTDIKKWKEIIKNSRHIIEIITDKIVAEVADDRKRGKMVSDKLIPYLASIASSIEQAHFVNLISDKLNIPEESIRIEINKYEPETGYVSREIRSNTFSDQSETLNFRKPAADSGENLQIEKQLLGILFWQQNSKNPVVDCAGLEKYISEHIYGDFAAIKNQIEKEKDNLIFITEEMYAGLLEKSDGKTGDSLKKVISELIKNLKLKNLLKQREVYRQKLKPAETENDDKTAKESLEKIQELSKEINNLN